MKISPQHQRRDVRALTLSTEGKLIKFRWHFSPRSGTGQGTPNRNDIHRTRPLYLSGRRRSSNCYRKTGVSSMLPGELSEASKLMLNGILPLLLLLALPPLLPCQHTAPQTNPRGTESTLAQQRQQLDRRRCYSWSHMGINDDLTCPGRPQLAGHFCWCRTETPTHHSRPTVVWWWLHSTHISLVVARRQPSRMLSVSLIYIKFSWLRRNGSASNVPFGRLPASCGLVSAIGYDGYRRMGRCWYLYIKIKIWSLTTLKLINLRKITVIQSYKHLLYRL